MHLSFARDDTNHAGWDNERLLFSRDNGLIGSGPIADGRGPAERVQRVITFTGQSLSVPSGAMSFLRLSRNAYDWESSSVRHSAADHTQGAALRVESGRMVILGEAGMLSAQVDPLGFKMGMNTTGNDNKQLALNIVHWLTHVLD
jgi:hypothetical protein